MKYSMLFMIIFLSCNSNELNKIGRIENIQFKGFISRQHIIKLPHTINLYQNDYKTIPSFDSDTVFVKDRPISFYGLLDDTTVYYNLIGIYPGDDLYPILYTFDKNGKLLDKGGLLIGFGPGPYEYSLNGYTNISKDLKIFTQDSIHINYLDSLGRVSFKETYVQSRHYKISTNGRINASRINKKTYN